MPVSLLELGIDPSRFPKAVSLKPLQIGAWDRGSNDIQRKFILGEPVEAPSREIVFSSAAGFFVNTAGVPARLWRASQPPDFFIDGTDSEGKPIGVSIVDELKRGRFSDPWQALSALLRSTYSWSLREEQKRLIQMAHRGDGNPAQMLFEQLDRLASNTPHTSSELLVETVEEVDRHATKTTSDTMAAIFKMVEAQVEAHGVAPENRGCVSLEIASNTYRLIAGLQTVHPSFNSAIVKLFNLTLERPAEFSMDLYQLENGSDQGVFMNVSQLFVNHVLRETEADATRARRGCVAGRIVVNDDLIPDSWEKVEMAPLTEEMYATVLETAPLLYEATL